MLAISSKLGAALAVRVVGPSKAGRFRAIAPRLETLSEAERQLLAEWLDRAINAL